MREKITKAEKWTDKIKQERETDENKKNESDLRMNLNILAPTNFEDVKREIIRLASMSKEMCSKAVDGIIAKAISDQKYAATYAKLCKELIRDPVMKKLDESTGGK